MKKLKIKPAKYYLSLFIAIAVTFFTGCANTDYNVRNNDYEKQPTQNTEELTADKELDKNEDNTETSTTITTESTTSNTENIFDGYKLIEVDGGNLTFEETSLSLTSLSVSVVNSSLICICVS